MKFYIKKLCNWIKNTIWWYFIKNKILYKKLWNLMKKKNKILDDSKILWNFIKFSKNKISLPAWHWYCIITTDIAKIMYPTIGCSVEQNQKNFAPFYFEFFEFCEYFRNQKMIYILLYNEILLYYGIKYPAHTESLSGYLIR